METTDYKLFRRNLLLFRAIAGLSGRALSETLKMKAPNRIHDIEEGRTPPKLDEVCTICKHFGHKMDDMLYKKAEVIIKFRE